jgi:hypothetical protein
MSQREAWRTASYKNFWALNVDEVIVTGRLRDYLGNNAEVLMPLNAQLKNVDLVVMNMQNKKSVTLQVKSSRSYDPAPREVAKYGNGSTCWLWLPRRKIDTATADYFVFVLYARETIGKAGRLEYKPHMVTIRPKELSAVCAKQKPTKKGETYDFAIWIDPPSERVFDFHTRGVEAIDFAPFLDERGFDSIKSEIG